MKRKFFKNTFSYLVLFGFAVFANIATGANIETAKGKIAVHIEARLAHQIWIAEAFEQNIYRDLYTLKTLSSVNRSEVDISQCHKLQIACLLEKYKRSGVDIVLLGEFYQDRLKYRAYDTFSKSSSEKIEVSLGSDIKLMSLRYQTLKLLKPFIETGGILDERSLSHASKKNEKDEGLPWPFLIPLLGGAAWAIFLYLTFRYIISPLPGLEGIQFRILFSVLRAWTYIFIFRAILLAVLLWPLMRMVFSFGERLNIASESVNYLGLPLAGLFEIFCIKVFFDFIASHMDRRLVSGAATSENSWSRHIKSYFLSYCERLGLEFDSDWLENVLFLPGNNDFDAISYGTSLSKLRVVVHENVLEYAMGSLEDLGRTDTANTLKHRDFLFGILLNEVGKLQRRSQYTTTIVYILLSIPWRNYVVNEFIDVYDKAVNFFSWLYQIGFGRYSAILATAYIALNFGKHHMIQYLYLLRDGSLETLTTMADSDQLFKVSVEILSEFGSAYKSRPELRVPGNTCENRLVWLSQHFYSPIEESRGFGFRAAFLVLGLTLGIGWVQDHISETQKYTAIYRDRIQDQEIDLRIKKLRERKVNEQRF
ncbi:MAG: hypothetical protein A4S09_14320 [Proteobacteria bacterium SG_bin7]|nr:MAG: hypothetical protein A4S09_14320 [Proteobacteria bacterium SG_bin7]